MDKETGTGNENKDNGRVDWREGKVSGTVYRMYTYFSLGSQLSHILLRFYDPQIAMQT